jgi:adenylate kinase family enzyme
MKKELIILRGPSGAGKSFIANELAGETGLIFSADDYFTDKNGKYNWDRTKIKDAHEWNYNRIKTTMEIDISPIIVDNTNITLWELGQLKPLLQFAIENNYEIKIKEPNTIWAFDAEELYKRNTHGVPLETIQRQIRKYKHNVTIEDILNYNE